MFKRVAIIFCVLFSALIFADTAQAGDTRCWTEQKCKDARAGFVGGDQEQNEGFYWKKDAWEACGYAASGGMTRYGTPEKVGFCLPVGQSITKISFGGKRSFANIGDFIQYAYKYGMWLAGIIAVALIIISGVQWAASGGNSDMIGSAKNRIAGAISGLILLALSYTVLSTINPYLVQLRLPQAWLINTIGMSAPSCSEENGDILPFVKSDTPTKEKDAQKEAFLKKLEGGEFKLQTKKDATCGWDYMVKGTQGQTCQGNLCSAGKICGSVIKDDKLTSAKKCWGGDLMVNFSTDILNDALSTLPLIGIGVDQLKENWLPGAKVKVIGICETPEGACVSTESGEELTLTQNPYTGNELLPRYLRIYSGLKDLKTSTFCKDTENKSLKGIIIENELNQNWKFENRLLYLGIPSSGNKAYIGDFTTVFDNVKNENAATVDERIKAGLQLDAVVTYQMLKKINALKSKEEYFTIIKADYPICGSKNNVKLGGEVN